jgi:hypothetical protein
MKILRKQALELFAVLNHTNFEMPISSRFRYMLTQNIKVLTVEVDAIKAAFPEPTEYAKIDTEYKELLTRFEVSDISEVQTMEVEKLGLFNAEYDVIKPKLDTAKAEYDSWVKERDEFLLEDIDINLDTVKVDIIPDISKNNQWPHWEIWSIIELLIKE